MKPATEGAPLPAPLQACQILDLIRNDHELIGRLKITPEEIEALSKCATFGTLTCKADMLFILRQIRQAGGPMLDQPSVFSQPAAPEPEEEDPVPPECRRVAVRLAGASGPGPGWLEDAGRRREFGVRLWRIILVVGLAGTFLIAMSRSRNNFMTGIGMLARQAHSSAAWYSNLDQPFILLWGELLFVAGFGVAIYLKSLRGRRRFKARPG